jgi:hypothetical protein
MEQNAAPFDSFRGWAPACKTNLCARRSATRERRRFLPQRTCSNQFEIQDRIGSVQQEGCRRGVESTQSEAQSEATNKRQEQTPPSQERIVAGKPAQYPVWLFVFTKDTNWLSC